VTRAGDIFLAAALLALAGAAGWWLGRRPDPRLAAQLETLRTTNRQLDSAVQAYRAAGPSADTVIVHARATAAVHDTVVVGLIDSVLLAAPDTLVPVLERIRAAHVATVASYETALDATTARLARADSLLARSEQLRQANLALAAAAVKHSGRGVFVIAVGIGATWAGERLAVGPTVSVGVRVPLGPLMR
jgi:hypothetical protein